MERFKKFFNNVVNQYKKLNLARKTLLLGIVIAIGVSLFFSINISTEKELVYLFKSALPLKDVAVISAELEKQQIPFEVLEDKYIVVDDEQTGTKVRMDLAQRDLLPNEIKGWEIFDIESWTTTEFDRDVRLRRAIQGEIQRHIQSIAWIERAEVSISVPESTLYTERAKDVQAAVTIVPSEGYSENLQNKTMIKGIENILARGIDGLSHDNIVITDAAGNQINLFAGEDYEDQIKQAYEQNKVRDLEVRKIKRSIEESLLGVLPGDRFRVAVDVEFNFNKEKVSQKEILPVVIKERTPNLAYDDSIVRDSVRISRKKLTENFEGFGFVPEGPPGQEPNLPPGYKESLEGKNIYNKDEEVDNFVNGEKLIEQVADAIEIERKSVSVTVDGTWDYVYDELGALILENSKLLRKYSPVSQEELSKFESSVRASINFDAGRGDSVVVRNIAFDRAVQFALEDAAYIRAQRIRIAIIWIVAITLTFLVLFFVIRAISRFITQRRLAKLTEQNLLQQLQREEALSDLDEVLSKEPGLSEKEKEAIRIQEEVNLMVDSNPKEVGRLIATLIMEKS